MSGKKGIYVKACRLGDRDLFVWMFNTFPVLHCRRLQESAFIASCISGNIDLVKSVVSLTGITHKTEINSVKVIQWVCIHGHLRVADWMIDKFIGPNPTSWDIYGARYNVLSAAINAKASLETIRWIVERFSVSESYIRMDSDCAFSSACSVGNLSIAKWIAANYIRPNSLSQAVCRLCFRSCCGRGDVQLTSWLYDTFPEMCLTRQYIQQEIIWASIAWNKKLYEWLNTLRI